MKFDMNSTVWRLTAIETSKLPVLSRCVNDKVLIALNAGWNSRSDTKEGHFNFYVSLNMLFNFCENYKRVVVNACLELILI